MAFEICREVREKKEYSDYHGFWQKRMDIDKIRGLGLGADDYHDKAVFPSELVARVVKHIWHGTNVWSEAARRKMISWRIAASRLTRRHARVGEWRGEAVYDKRIPIC